MGGGTSHTRKDYQTLIDIAETREDVAMGFYSLSMSRTRVYPRIPSDAITLTPDAAADTYGAWTEIIPAGTVAFPYKIHILQTEGVGGADTFMVQLAINAAPAGNQYLGERRFNLGAAGRNQVDFDCPTIAPGIPVYGRVQTAAGANTLDVSVAYTRCICTTDMIKLLSEKRTVWP